VSYWKKARDRIWEELLEVTLHPKPTPEDPVAVLFSGGIDSTLLLAMLAREHPRSVVAITIAFWGSDCDESIHATRIAQRLGVRHVVHDLTDEDVLANTLLIPKVYPNLLDNPSAVPTLKACELARPYSRVITGELGDELFYGYDRYRAALWLKHIPYRLRKAIANRLPRVAEQLPLKRPNMDQKWKKLEQLLQQPTVVDEIQSRWWDTTLAVNWRDPISTLHKTVFAALHHGLRLSMPFVDFLNSNPFLATSLPRHYHLSPFKGKLILRSILSHYLPKPLWDRPKQGFGVPLTSWYASPLKPLLESKLNLQPHQVEAIDPYDLWSMLMKKLYHGKEAQACEEPSR